MVSESKRVEEIYAGRVAKTYDLKISHFFGKYKEQAFSDSSLKSGDRVLVFCCGTGLDFPYILKRIGENGSIVGVDFSSEMLNKAREKTRKKKWSNVELMEADITRFKGQLEKEFDAGVCTLGMSIIPEYESAYRNLLSHVKKHGEIIIGDMQLAPGWFARLNPLTIFLAKAYGGTYEGHQNSVELCSMMQKELAEVRKREFFFKSYFYCIGRTK